MSPALVKHVSCLPRHDFMAASHLIYCQCPSRTCKIFADEMRFNFLLPAEPTDAYKVVAEERDESCAGTQF